MWEKIHQSSLQDMSLQIQSDQAGAIILHPMRQVEVAPEMPTERECNTTVNQEWHSGHSNTVCQCTLKPGHAVSTGSTFCHIPRSMSTSLLQRHRRSCPTLGRFFDATEGSSYRESKICDGFEREKLAQVFWIFQRAFASFHWFSLLIVFFLVTQ